MSYLQPQPQFLAQVQDLVPGWQSLQPHEQTFLFLAIVEHLLNVLFIQETTPLRGGWSIIKETSSEGSLAVFLCYEYPLGVGVFEQQVAEPL